MRLRRPSKPELIIQTVLALAVLWLGASFASAFIGDACRGAAGPACWPWGFEGPFADSWSHRSRINTLIWIGAHILLLLVAGLLALVARKPRAGLVILVGLPVAGFLALSWLNRALAG